VQPRPSTGAGAYAADLTAAFEQALQLFLAELPGHRPLVEYAVLGGHRTRPIGCLLACGAVGGDWRTSLDAAVGIELLHKSSVIRDDIADGDEVRSGQPAFHAVHGTAKAIAVSDLLWTYGLERIAGGAPAPTAAECLRAATAVLHEMANGQLEDICPSPGRRATEDRLLVDERKTGSLSGLACRLGAIIGGGSPAEVAGLTRYGRKIGTAFQVLNDVRNLTGEETSRIAASDVRKGRDTVLSAHVREQGGRRAPLTLVSNGGPDDLSDAEVEAVRADLLAARAAEFGEALCSQLLDEARAQLKILAPGPATAILDALTRGVLREHAF
jgi:geranylgeranyl diphosphate synthase, type I